MNPDELSYDQAIAIPAAGLARLLAIMTSGARIAVANRTPAEHIAAAQFNLDRIAAAHPNTAETYRDLALMHLFLSCTDQPVVDPQPVALHEQQPLREFKCPVCGLFGVTVLHESLTPAPHCGVSMRPSEKDAERATVEIAIGNPDFDAARRRVNADVQTFIVVLSL